jgi:Icc-related predicted phosphoesterase
MRFWIFSDLHLDINARFPWVLPDPRPDHDAVIIAGDLCEDMAQGVRWIAAQALNNKPVLYVGGNHEFYGHDRHQGLADARHEAAQHANIHVLERDSIQLGDVTIHGCTLWTDYNLYGTPEVSMAAAERLLSDHRMIALGRLKWSAAAALNEHQASVAWLTERLASGIDQSKTVVVSHHAPTPLSSSARFQDHPLTAAFASDLSPLLSQTGAWVHGHTHRAVNMTHMGCRIVNNPRGYVRHETTGFQYDLILSV